MEQPHSKTLLDPARDALRLRHYTYRTDRRCLRGLDHALHLVSRQAPSSRDGRRRGAGFSHPPGHREKRRRLHAPTARPLVCCSFCTRGAPSRPGEPGCAAPQKAQAPADRPDARRDLARQRRGFCAASNRRARCQGRSDVARDSAGDFRAAQPAARGRDGGRVDLGSEWQMSRDCLHRASVIQSRVLRRKEQ